MSYGNYEAFIRPRKPQGVDGKSAYLIGGGIGSLTAAGNLEQARAVNFGAVRQAPGAKLRFLEPTKGSRRGLMRDIDPRSLMPDVCKRQLKRLLPASSLNFGLASPTEGECRTPRAQWTAAL